MAETELKFGVPDDAVAAIDAALRRRGARLLVVESHYWDSADRCLAKAGITLRLRKSAGRWEQTVKARGSNPVERVEETVLRPGRWPAAGPAPELGPHAGTPAGAALEAALGRGAKAAPLAAQHASSVRRRSLQIEVAGGVVEVSLDRGSIDAGSRSMPVCEVEAELKAGDGAGLVAVGRASVDAHGAWLSTVSKAERGVRLASGSPIAAVKGRAGALRRGAGGAAIFRAIAVACLEHVLANASIVAAGAVDDEAIHQLRVGLRRLRTAWRELPAWHGALAPTWEAPATDVFRRLGEYRDRQTVAAPFEARLGAAGSPDPSLGARSGVDPVALVRGGEFQHALLDVLAFVLAADAEVVRVPALAAPSSRSAGDDAERSIAARLAKLHARLRRDAKRFATLDEAERHRVRKRLKRLRYLSELVGPLYRGVRVRRYLAQIAPAQDALGAYTDLVVAARLARAVVDGGDAHAWFNVGYVQALVPAAVEDCAKALKRAARARPFWPGAGAADG